MSSVRAVTHISTAHRQKEGGGFIVRRPFPTQGLDHLDPLLMLDELGPITYGPSTGKTRSSSRFQRTTTDSPQPRSPSAPPDPDPVGRTRGPPAATARPCTGWGTPRRP